MSGEILFKSRLGCGEAALIYQPSAFRLVPIALLGLAPTFARGGVNIPPDRTMRSAMQPPTHAA